jgi:3-oxoacyl-[acyl-carrier-protein] synthase III
MLKLNLDHTKPTLSEVFGQSIDFSQNTLLTLMQLTRTAEENSKNADEKKLEKSNLFEQLFNAMNITTLEAAVLLGIQFAEITMAALSNANPKDISSIEQELHKDSYELNEKKVQVYFNEPGNDF